MKVLVLIMILGSAPMSFATEILTIKIGKECSEICGHGMQGVMSGGKCICTRTSKISPSQIKSQSKK